MRNARRRNLKKALWERVRNAEGDGKRTDGHLGKKHPEEYKAVEDHINSPNIFP